MSSFPHAERVGGFAEIVRERSKTKRIAAIEIGIDVCIDESDAEAGLDNGASSSSGVRVVLDAHGKNRCSVCRRNYEYSRTLEFNVFCSISELGFKITCVMHLISVMISTAASRNRWRRFHPCWHTLRCLREHAISYIFAV